MRNNYTVILMFQVKLGTEWADFTRLKLQFGCEKLVLTDKNTTIK